MKNSGFVKFSVFLIFIVLVGAVVFLGKDYLPFGFTDISELVAYPQKFEGQTVKVRGQVTDTLKIPFIDAKSYMLNDGSGEILVVTTQVLPTEGGSVAIIAFVDNTAIIGGEVIGLRLQEIKKLPEFVRILE